MQSTTFTLTQKQLLCQQSVDPLDSAQTLIIVFARRDVPPAILTGVAQRFPQSQIIGCSTAGQIINDNVVDEKIVIGVMQFEKTKLQFASADINLTNSSFEAGENIATQLNDDGLRAMFVLSDGLLINGSELVLGINSVVNEHVCVTGGLAGDGDQFESTWVIENKVAKSGCITAVGFYGDDLKVAHGCAGGWDKFGVVRTVTKATSNVLFELDSQPALELYKEYLGERAAGLPATGLLFPLALRKTESADQQEHVVRTILAIDEEKNALIFAGDIPVGAKVQLMRANFDRLIDGAVCSAESLMKMKDMQAGLVIAISCVGRRLVLGERIDEETQATLEALPKGSQQVGFYSYGEISPYTSGHCELHNQTMTLTLFNEE
jgi:hypothetical protein